MATVGQKWRIQESKKEKGTGEERSKSEGKLSLNERRKEKKGEAESSESYYYTPKGSSAPKQLKAVSRSKPSFSLFKSPSNPNTLSTADIKLIRKELDTQRKSSITQNDLLVQKKDVGYHLLSSQSAKNFDISNQMSDRKLRPRLMIKGIASPEKSTVRHQNSGILSLMKRQIGKLHEKSCTHKNIISMTSRVLKTDETLTRRAAVRSESSFQG